MDDQPPKSQRRWLRFSLRSILVLVAVVGIGLAYELNWIHQRRDFIATQAAAIANFLGGELRDVELDRPAPTEVPIATQILSLFGEPPRQAVMVIFFDDTRAGKLTQDDKQALERARRLFPESLIMWKLVKAD